MSGVHSGRPRVRRPVRLPLAACVAMLAVLVLSGCPAPRIASPDGLPHFETFVTTADGWRLSLFRVPPTGTPSGPPVLLVHGTATNRMTFLLEGSDLATHLAQAGFDVWIPELRGTRTSQPPDAGTWKEGAWTLDEMASQDVPAILDAIASATKQREVLWVGHSLGGILGYAVAQGPRKDAVAGLVTVGSPMSFTHPTDLAVRSRSFPGTKAKKGRMPMRSWANLAKGSVRIAPDGQIVHMLVNAENMDVDAIATFASLGVEDISAGLLAQLGRWIEGGTVTGAGVDWTAGLATVRAPALVIAGSVDQVAPPWAVRPAFEGLGASDKTWLKLGRAGGQREDYGHLDLVVGDWAHEEVFPAISAWLTARSAEGAP